MKLLVPKRMFYLSLLALGPAACDIPTELPILEPRLVFEAEKTTLAVSQLLPSNVTVQGNAFSLNLTSTTVTRTLGELCPQCIPFNGLTVPKPAFTAQLPPASSSLPAGVRSVVLSNSTLNLQLFNGFSFDPLRPSATARGSLAVRITSGGAVIADTTFSGNTIALPINQTTNIPVALRPGTVTNGSNIILDVTITSPAGDPVQINTSAQLQLTPINATASSATVDVVNRNVSVPQVVLGLEDIDDGIIDHVKSGALVVIVENPFNVTGTLNLTFAPAVIASKPVQIAPGSSSPRVELTQAELRLLLGRSIVVNISGRVNGPAGGVTVLPTQLVNISTRIDLILTTADPN